MAIRSFGKADRGVQVSRWDPLPQGSPGEQSADNRQGDGSIPWSATKFHMGPGTAWGGRFPCKEDSQQGSIPWGSTKFAWIAEMD